MKALIIINKERGDSAQYEAADQLISTLRRQGIMAQVSELSFTNPEIGYYDSFPRVSLEALRAVDIVIVLGGDGSKNYVANVIIHENLNIPVIGVSRGTHNVGKLNTARVADFDAFSSFKNKNVSALKIEVEDEVYYAFHDIIFASTFITGYEGKSTQLSAEAIMKGIRRKEPPKLIGDLHTDIRIDRQDGTAIKMPKFDPVGLISSAELASYPKYMVMSGAANHPINEGAQAGVILSKERIVWPERSLQEYCKAEPIITAFASYSGQDKLCISGLNNDAYLIIDGNAVCPVGQRNVTIMNCANAIEVKTLSD